MTGVDWDDLTTWGDLYTWGDPLGPTPPANIEPAAWRPDLYIQCAFNANPNDPTTVPVWSDLSSADGLFGFVGADGVTRGRQYELDQNQAAQPTLNWLDPAEYLNPANTESPFYPNVVPMRQLLWQAVWPNPGTGNLLNSNQPASSILGTDDSGYDTSFESYPTGYVPLPWIRSHGLVTPVISMTHVQQGTKALAWSTATRTDRQGVSLVVPAIPGQQMCISGYLYQTNNSMQALSIGGLNQTVDAFNRSVLSGWGADDLGDTWTTVGGSASDYSVLPGTGIHAVNSVATSRATIVGSANADVDAVGYVSTDQLAVGAPIRVALLGRYADASNCYMAAADLGTDQSITLSLIARVAGVETVLGSTVLSTQHVAGQVYGMRLTITGASLSTSMWRQYATEPAAPLVSVTNASITGGGPVGCYSLLSTGNTNPLPVHVFWENISGTCTVIGATTTTGGAFVRLQTTFIATQPTHTIYFATTGSVTAGSVWLDAIQYEFGSTASAYTTTGSTIYGVFRGYVERWPSSWDNGGFLGLCQTTGVDAFEPLNLYTLNSTYYQQVLKLAPDYYWPLNDGPAATTFGEQSGHNGPPLVKIDSKSGPAENFAPATPMTITGDPGATGVTDYSTSVSGTHATAIGTLPNSGLLLGAADTCELTLAVWISFSGDFVPFSAANPAVSLFHWALTTSGTLVQLSGFYSSGLGSPPNDLAFVLAGAAEGLESAPTDGLPHLYVMTIYGDAALTLASLYLDGHFFGGAGVGPRQPYVVNSIQVAGAVDPSTKTGAAGWPNGIYAHLAVWNRGLSDDEILSLWTAGGLGNAGETSGERVTDLVTAAWTGLTDIDTGSAIMGASPVTADQSVLSAVQAVTTTEQGNFWADKDGVVTFAGRDRRYLDLTSLWVFGEDIAAGELPYKESIGFDLDPTFISNAGQIQNSDGTIATVTSPASQSAYFPRSNATQANLLSDDDAIQLGYWIINTHAQATQRISQISLSPNSYPQLWPVVLGIEVGNRVTVVRRPSAANAGAGLVMSADYFVEQVSHTGIDLTAGTWTTTLLLSPAQETSDVFIFDDPTYGQFDGPGVLAY